MQFAVIVIFIGAVIISILIGWERYFVLYLVAAAIVIINSFSITMNWKLFQVALISVFIISLLIFTGGGFRVYTINSEILK